MHLTVTYKIIWLNHFPFSAQLETMTVKKQDKAHTTSVKLFHTGPYPTRALSIPP